VGAHGIEIIDCREGSGAGEVGLDRQGSAIYIKGAGLDPGHCRGPLKGNAVIWFAF